MDVEDAGPEEDGGDEEGGDRDGEPPRDVEGDDRGKKREDEDLVPVHGCWRSSDVLPDGLRRGASYLPSLGGFFVNDMRGSVAIS